MWVFLLSTKRWHVTCRREGMQQGELHAKLATARNMLAEKAELSFVLRVTGLSEEQLREHGII